MTSFKALGRLDSSRGWKERPEERQGCWGPQLHAIRIAKAWLFDGGWKQPGDPSRRVFDLGVFWGSSRETQKNVQFFLKHEKFSETMMKQVRSKNWEFDNFWIFLQFAVNTCSQAALRKTCLLLPVAHVIKGLALHKCWKPQWIWGKNFCFHRLVDDYLRATMARKRKRADSTHSCGILICTITV